MFYTRINFYTYRYKNNVLRLKFQFPNGKVRVEWHFFLNILGNYKQQK